MVKKSNAGNGDAARHLRAVNDVAYECYDKYKNKSSGIVSVRFVLAVEFTCISCKKTVVVKVETPDEKIICPACLECEMTLTDTFNKLLAAANRPTPHRKVSHDQEKQTNKVGRPTFGDARRKYAQTTLDPHTIRALNELNVSRGALFEFLLDLFPPFTNIPKSKKLE